eukprot:693256-Prorocentrum_minimum.AAC.47
MHDKAKHACACALCCYANAFAPVARDRHVGDLDVPRRRAAERDAHAWTRDDADESQEPGHRRSDLDGRHTFRGERCVHDVKDAVVVVRRECTCARRATAGAET